MGQVVGVLPRQRGIGWIHRRLGVGAVARRAIEFIENGLAGGQVLRLDGSARHGESRAQKGKHRAIHCLPLI
ncbi:hypothetical protein D3C84_1212820 [compost metagenome]